MSFGNGAIQSRTRSYGAAKRGESDTGSRPRETNRANLSNTASDQPALQDAADDVFRDTTAGLEPAFVEDRVGDKRGLV
jgi:hypothetical protein